MDTNRRQTMVEYVERWYQEKGKDEKFDIQMELANAADAKIRMNDILFDDIRSALEDVNKQSDSQFKRRTFIRTMFAHIEAQLSMMRQVVVTWYRLGAIKVNDDDLKKLADEIRVAWDPSQIPEKTIRLKLTDGIKFTFKLFGSTPGKSFITFDTNSTGWQSFLIAVKIRDNLMHPKIEQNLLISDADFMHILNAWGWYSDISSRVLNGNK